jgi:DNA-directed RNA polymerase subunit RPC12/RpoP
MMKQIHTYKLDLTKIDGSGDLSCPQCGSVISPDDITEKAYSILETKVSKHGLEEAVIRCNRCTSQIHLSGFSLLQKISG